MTRLIVAFLMLGAWSFSSLVAQTSKGFHIKNSYVNSVRIPIEVFNNLILVQVQVNNSFPMYFIVDTGVKTTLLTEPIILALVNMQPMTPIKVRGLGAGELIEADLARGLRMELPNGIVGDNMRMIVLPENAVNYSAMFGRPVVGILGADLFKNFVVEVNYFRGYIRLTRPEKFKPKKKDVMFPIEMRKSKPYLKATLIGEAQDTLTTYWLLDTGSSQAVSVFNDKLQVPEKSLDAFIGQGISGSMFGKIGRMKDLNIGPFSFENLVVSFPDSTYLRWVKKGQDHYSNIGSGVLSRLSVTFDYQNERIYLRKNPHYKRTFDYNTCGLETVAVGALYDSYIISYVRPNSPAEEAGVKVGDQLLSINGYEVNGLDVGEVNARLNRREGHRLCIRLARKGERFKACFTLQSGI